jgi:hypothetical protein
MRMSLLSIVLAILLSTFGHQTLLAEGKIPVEVKATSDDTVGKRLVYRIKEDIRRSATFEITSNTKVPRLKITIVTLDPIPAGSSGISTIFSYVMLASGVYFDDIFITSGVGICGLQKINNVAQNMVAEIDNYTESFETAKKDWDYFGEALRGNFKTKEDKLIGTINELENKVSGLEDQLKKEKAKSWWDKLMEKFETIYSSVKNDETQKKRNEQNEEEKNADEKEWQK